MGQGHDAGPLRRGVAPAAAGTARLTAERGHTPTGHSPAGRAAGELSTGASRPAVRLGPRGCRSVGSGRVLRQGANGVARDDRAGVRAAPVGGRRPAPPPPRGATRPTPTGRHHAQPFTRWSATTGPGGAESMIQPFSSVPACPPARRERQAPWTASRTAGRTAAGRCPPSRGTARLSPSRTTRRLR